jgi:uncharacterized glyoxalase superfamily protein PhnB
MMLPTNRSIPRCSVIPELAYADVGQAVDWLCETFGFTVRLRIGNHRAQLNVGDCAIVVMDRRGNGGTDRAHAVMVRVEDVKQHHAHVSQQIGARVLGPPVDYPYGERQYSVQDPGGHVWTFSQSIADVDPKEWGGTAGEL